MNSNIISLILGAGAAAFNYHYIGKRLGYSNTKKVWITTVVVFVIAYLIFLSTLVWVFHL